MVRDCTPDNPMPKEHNATDGWVHHDVTEIADYDTMGVLYKCNSCGLEFIADNTRGD